MNGVTFGNKHSFADFNIVLTSRDIPIPEPKTYTIDVPSADGELDLSTALTGGMMKYRNRNIKMNFTILSPINQLESVKSAITNYLHGKTMQVIFDADNTFYYEGRCKITNFNTDKYPATMTIELNADPYKYNISETTITRTVSNSETITVPEQKMNVVPTITVSANMTLTYKSTQYSLLSGNNVIPNLILSSGNNNVLTFTGNGNVTIKFRGGEL